MGTVRSCGFSINGNPLPLDKSGDTQKLDTSVDNNLPDDRDSASIFSRKIGHELYHGSSADLYLHCRMDFMSNVFQTEVPQFVDLGIPDVNTLDELGMQGTPAARIRRPTDGSHWFAPDHVFGKAIAVIMSATRLEQDYIFKTDFNIWKENQDFGRQNI